MISKSVQSGRDCVRLCSIVLLSLTDSVVSKTMQGTRLGNCVVLLDCNIIVIAKWQFRTLYITQLEFKYLGQRSVGTCRFTGSRL
jgi:hypothetical protein